MWKRSSTCSAWRCLGGDHLQVRPPHVAAHKAQPADHRRPQRRQAPAQGGLRAPSCPPTTAVGNGCRSGRSPSGNCPPACLCPSESRRCRWPRCLPGSGGPSPTAQTTPPSDKPPPNWSGRLGPSRATTDAAPSAPRNPIIAMVIGRLPSLQGMCSTTTPCSGHFTRRGA